MVEGGGKVFILVMVIQTILTSPIEDVFDSKLGVNENQLPSEVLNLF